MMGESVKVMRFAAHLVSYVSMGRNHFCCTKTNIVLNLDERHKYTDRCHQL